MTQPSSVDPQRNDHVVDADATPVHRRRLFTAADAARVLCAVVAVMLLLSWLDADAISAHLRRANPFAISWLLVMSLVVVVVEAVRILPFLRTAKAGLWISVQLNLVAGFFGHFLPSAVGGDAYKVFFIRQRGYTVGQALAAVIIDRGTSFAIIVTCGLVYVLLAPLPQSTQAALTDALQQLQLLASNNIIGAMFAFTVLLAAAALFARKVIGRLKQMQQQLFATVGIAGRRVMAHVLFWSVVTWLARVVLFDAMLRSAGITLPLGTHILALTMIYVSLVLPISFGNIGVQESITVAVYSQFAAVPPEAAAAAAILMRAALWAVGLLGGAVWLARRGQWTAAQQHGDATSLDTSD